MITLLNKCLIKLNDCLILYIKAKKMNYNEKQIQIVDAAEVLFAEKGFEGTSVRDIAEAAGINIAMISYYFGSKEKLMEALFDLRTGHVAERVDSMLTDESISPFKKVEFLIDEHIDKAFDKHLFYRIMVTEQLINKNSILTEALKGLKKRNLERITRLLEDGQQKGVFKTGMNTWMLVNTLIGTVSQTVMNKTFYKDNFQEEGISDEALKLKLKKELGDHLKKLFKSILTYEA